MTAITPTPTSAHRLPTPGVVLAAVIAALVLASCSSSSASGSGSQRPRPVSLLVVGDSVATQAAAALVHLAPAGETVSVDAVEPGTAPCDWDHGFTDPTDHQFRSFADTMRTVRPAAVAFVFTGNPGLSGPSAGCVDANTPYDLAQLLASYERAIEDMAKRAIRAGAIVYLEAPPPRNPDAPIGYSAAEQANFGFQGSPAIATFYQSLVDTKNSRYWKYDDNAAAAVSTPNLTWQLTLPCEPWDIQMCTNGQVQVRDGGIDAVHLDPAGCGAVRFALGLEERPLHPADGSVPPPDPNTVASEVAGYGGCQQKPSMP